jgi:CRP-like cAMP-binding protein
MLRAHAKREDEASAFLVFRAWAFSLAFFGAAIFAPAERPFAVHSHSAESVFGAPAQELTMVSSGNRLLNAFDSATRERVDPFLEKIEVAIGDILCESGGVLDHAYFPDGAVLSLQTVLRNGSAVETINIGREGAFGLLSGLYMHESFNRALVQLPGVLVCLPFGILYQEFERSGRLRSLVVKYSRAQVVQIQQTVACNALYTTRQRFCRWLLMMLDRIDGDSMPCTHELPAEILGVNRKSVTLAAQKLHKEGLIDYHRGRISTVLVSRKPPASAMQS